MDQECKKCKTVFPWTNEYFTWERKKEGLLKKICRDCFHKLAKEYRDKYKMQREYRKEDAIFNMEIIDDKEKQKLLFNACATIYHNAFELKLSKEEFEKLNITA